MIVSALLLVAGLIVRTDNRLSLLLFVLAYLPVSLPVMRSAWSEMRHGAWANEFTLMLLALLGGSLGTLLAMCACHHKTQHKKFTILVPLLLVLQTVLVVVLAIASKQ